MRIINLGLFYNRIYTIWSRRDADDKARITAINGGPIDVFERAMFKPRTDKTNIG